MTFKVAMLQPLDDALAERVLSLVPEGFEMLIAKSTHFEDLVDVIKDAEYAIPFGMAISDELITAAPKLKLLHRWGVGVDGMPIEMCRQRGIMLAKTTGSNARPVAEYTVGAMLASARMLNIAHKTMQEGKWAKKQLWPQIVMLSGRTVGLIGLGTIGQLVARRLRGFECRILYNKRDRLSAALEGELNIIYASVDDIIDQADIISLHCPLTPQTRHMIARPQLERMKSDAILINTARGGVVNEADLAWALQNKVIRSAVIDVFEQEPTDPANPLLHLDNAIVTPHIAANAWDNIDNGVGHVFRNLRLHAAGKTLPADDVVVPAGS